MRFQLTALPGVLRIDAEPQRDARGLSARLWCPQEWAAAGIAGFISWQLSVSRNPTVHTLRGMHFQAAPHNQAALLRAVRGRAYAVVIDLRPDSPRGGQWIAVELDAAALDAVLVPEGCAHGFLTMEPDTDVLYQTSALQVPGMTRGVRWNDAAFGVRWPAEPALMDPRDACWPDWIAPRGAIMTLARS